MQLGSKYLYDAITQRPWASTNIDVQTSHITPRVRNAVARVLRGERIPPNSGDTKIISAMMTKYFELPTFCMQQNADRSIRVEYTGLSEEVRAFLTPFYQTERVALRLKGSEHRMMDFPWSPFHGDTAPPKFYGKYQYTRPIDALLQAREMHLSPKRAEIEQAIELINSGKTFNVTYKYDPTQGE